MQNAELACNMCSLVNITSSLTLSEHQQDWLFQEIDFLVPFDMFGLVTLEVKKIIISRGWQGHYHFS